MTPGRRATILMVGACVLSACVTAPPAPPPPTAPAYPSYATPVVPASLRASPEMRDRHDRAWRRLQAGDAAGAGADFTAILATDAAFYPAETGLAYSQLARGVLDDAVARFRGAVAVDEAYLPAWQGLMDASMASGDDAGAIEAIERVMTLDPDRSELRSRLDLLKFRRVQTLIAEGRKARDENRMTASLEAFERALAMSPTSGVLHREIAIVEASTGALDSALAHARRAIELSDTDAESHATLGAILEELGRDREAAEAFSRAVALDPRPEWRARSDRLGTRADLVVIPPEFRAVPTAETVTRAQVAAFVGIRLETLIARAQTQVIEVATDVSGHWAAPWILPVTQAGVMELFPNHTFQPATTVRRGELAQVVAQLLTLNQQRRMDLLRWQAMRPTFDDLPASNLFYAAVAVAVSSGAMSAQADGRFRATEPATGPDLVAAIARVELIAGR